MKTKDMTTGNPIKLILAFAVPLFIGNVFQQVYSLVDTMVAGYNLGDAAIAAIGSTSSIYSLIMNFAWGLNGGYSIVVTQKFGSHDIAAMKKSVAVMFALTSLGAVVLTAMTLVFIEPMMRFLNTPQSIFAQAKIYIVIICAGMFATLFYNMFAGFLRAVGNSKTPLYFLILSSVLNVVLDVLFVVAFKMGIAGAAAATVLAQIVSAVACGIYIFKNYKEYLPSKEDFKIEKPLYAEMLSAGFAMAMMQCIFATGSVILQRAINNLGGLIIAAHTAARRVIEILMMPLSTIAVATSTFIGQNWGAGKADRIKSGLRKSMLLEIAWGVIAMAFVFAFAKQCVILMTGTSDESVISNAVMNLKINFLFYPALGILICLRMAMQAMGQKIMPLAASSLELAMKFFAAFFVIPSSCEFASKLVKSSEGTRYFAASCTEPSTWLFCSLLLGSIYFATRKKNFARLGKNKIHTEENYEKNNFGSSRDNGVHGLRKFSNKKGGNKNAECC